MSDPTSLPLCRPLEWYTARGRLKRKACERELDITPDPVSLPARDGSHRYERPPMEAQNFVPDVY